MNDYTILYKSGNKVHLKAEGLEVTKYRSGDIEVKWDKMEPKPFLLGVNDIEAIFAGKV